LSSAARRVSESASGTIVAGRGSRASDTAGVADAASCNATSPGITTTETPRFDTAARIAISSVRGIWRALETSSQ